MPANVQLYNQCCFCPVKVQKILRHLERYHKDQPEVKLFLSKPKKTAERNAITTKLRNRGNNMMNVEILKKGSGTLRVARRGKTTVSVEDVNSNKVAECVNCKIFVRAPNLYRHRCQVLTNTEEGPVKKPGKLRAGKAELDMKVKGMTEEAASFLSSLRDDKCGREVKNDELVVKVLEFKLLQGEGKVINWKKQWRYRLRLLGRFIIKARSLLPGCSNLREILKVDNFPKIANAAADCAKFMTATGEDAANSVPLKIGFTLKTVLKFLDSEATINKDNVAEQNAQRLLKLYQNDWCTR
jgi:hypothetical protein